ncbi:P27 family phage terminase small subunit [Curtobacterium sp. ISL-83]|uniref:P27 family phage terminase small subunit n=1 Tax=Curtobacterium sp. ISL-83 TaxID=2819145 RepID=UPI001BED2851|nr:P27 family phage terminase small subunit [Curtobacterium sp. ISL-83]MBT2502989.1 hypothetical protein [Curtobacterium sp. ISL-83]
MTDSTQIPVPRSLKAAGRKLWKETTANYVLRQDELETLRAACAELDLIVRMEGELDTAELTVKGSMGQIVAHPLVQELRQHRATMSTLLRALRLPDSEASGLVNQQRSAAQSRWSASHGRSA